jgi:hypothetical protein
VKNVFKDEKIKEVLFETNLTTKAGDILTRLPL